MDEDEKRELHIKHCGDMMEANYAQGNREAAMAWLQAQNEAIKGRSAAQVARMEGCYFNDLGEQHRAHLEARA